MPATRADISRVARDGFGFERLRPGQAEGVASVVEGRDTLVVMPTGSGKSAIYQIAALMLQGPTVVVSPLIALQQDQVGALEERDVAGAAEANSTISEGAREAALDDLKEGGVEFLFLAPEQFANADTIESLRAARPSLFVVDEAHCISAWGHDFRPDYLRLGAVAEELGRPRLLALTATASPPVREEIVERLGMRREQVVVRGFDRPNIALSVESFHDAELKTTRLLERVEVSSRPGIVYAATRRRAEELARALRESGVDAAHYHGAMSARDRERAQDSFMDGATDVMVATVAFGMGIDKADVRFVFHHDVPDSLDSLYQELGRAGRDGGPAEAVLFYRQEDLGLRRFFAGGSIEGEVLERVLKALEERDGAVALPDLRASVDLSERRLRTVVASLEAAGVVDVDPDGRVAARGRGRAREAAAAAAHAEEVRARVERSRVEMLRSYAETRACRRQFLLNYFGEAYDAPCDNCDNCRAGETAGEERGRDYRGRAPFELNRRVAHKSWGHGVVVRTEGDKLVVLFDEMGYRTLSLDAVGERGLLEPLD